MTTTTKVAFNRLQLFALIDSIESVHIENLTREQLSAHDQLIPMLEDALDRIDSLEAN